MISVINLVTELKSFQPQKANQNEDTKDGLGGAVHELSRFVQTTEKAKLQKENGKLCNGRGGERSKKAKQRQEWTK